MSFEEKIRATANRNQSRTVLALDLEDHDSSSLIKRNRELIENIKDQICAIKINRQLVLALGIPAVSDQIIKLAEHLSIPTIMDAKLNDVGHTNEFMARTYFDAGFDAVIASPIVGWENGLDNVFALARARNRGVILLTYMSNPGAEAFYSLMAKERNGGTMPVFEILIRLGLEWKASGLIVGATNPGVISRVHDLAGSQLAIYSPGVGAQGGDAGRTVEAGATYLIVGRSIYASTDPRKAAISFRIPPALERD